MEFKIDTTKNFTYIMPEYQSLDAILAEKLGQKISSLQKEEVHNFIIDFKNVTDSDAAGRNLLLEIHSEVYNLEGSIVFTDLQESVLQLLKKEQLHLSLNITPTFIEAKDIINMEALERDLLNEL